MLSFVTLVLDFGTRTACVAGVIPLSPADEPYAVALAIVGCDIGLLMFYRRVPGLLKGRRILLKAGWRRAYYTFRPFGKTGGRP